MNHLLEFVRESNQKSNKDNLHASHKIDKRKSLAMTILTGRFLCIGAFLFRNYQILYHLKNARVFTFFHPVHANSDLLILTPILKQNEGV